MRTRRDKRSFPEYAMLILSLWPFIVSILQAVPGMPGFVKYIADGLLACISGLVILRGKIVFHRKLLPIVRWLGVFVVYTLLIYLLRFQSPFYYLWGFRNNIRFYLAFFIYVAWARESDANQWFSLLDKLFWIHFALSVFQFVFMGVRQDYLGGIFGTEKGTNGYTMLFLTVIILHSFLMVFNGEETVKQCVIKCIAVLLISAMAELKFFFVLFLMLLAMASLITNFSWKKLIIIAMSGLGVVLFSMLLVRWFGFEDFLSINSILEKALKRNYASARDLNRLSAIPVISDTLMTKGWDRLFGFGLGNCDTSSFAICNTPFFQRYSYLHYNWFSAPMLFLETGYIGLGMYFIFFGMVFFLSRKRMAEGTGNRMYCQMAMIMSLVCCVIAFYNSSLRIESAYMVYFVLALPFIGGEEQEKTESMPRRRQRGRARYRGRHPVSH